MNRRPPAAQESSGGAGGRRVSVALALVLALGTAWTATPQEDPESRAARRFRAIERALEEVVAKVRPATVAILTYRRIQHEGKERFQPASGGSGVLIDSRGYVLTNDHVAGYADRIEVILAGGRRLEGDLVAKDAKGDIALLKIEGSRFPSVPLGDSSSIRVGAWVLALGNPFMLGLGGEPVVTLGVVSGKNRVLGGRWLYGDSVQTDAEINPGNSGGPLFNLRGELIGINGKIATRHGLRANTGAGYAIPADVIRSCLPRLMRGKDVERGYSGIVVDAARAARGVRIRQVDRGSPAARRLRPNDVILAVNGRTVRSAREYTNLVSKLTAGRTLALQIMRGNRARTVRIRLAVDPARRAAKKRAANERKKGRGG